MECKFQVGQKVAAIEDLECGVAKGRILTVSCIEGGDFDAFDGTKQHVALSFYEVRTRSGYCGFDARFFRPVVSRKTDISIFTAMLTPKTEQVPA
ncbi:hypothetical protein HGP14_09485 [Rhizobium sp. P32RR-XVIII]|uniref:hypothetical protein n=1 Tax=Rhizobium sp. P32RR-XVIII TaxID=2726738 RepID=UPI00145716BE|nr:hypothetical protein [Rhizobium sp. P32RR-XVIII]NLS03589.1 hypothetical protein [Rhizobium sp. P32RR-XVIII]